MPEIGKTIKMDANIEENEIKGHRTYPQATPICTPHHACLPTAAACPPRPHTKTPPAGAGGACVWF